MDRLARFPNGLECGFLKVPKISSYQVNIFAFQFFEEAMRVVVVVHLAVVDGQVQSFDFVTNAETEEENGDRR